MKYKIISVYTFNYYIDNLNNTRLYKHFYLNKSIILENINIMIVRSK